MTSARPIGYAWAVNALMFVIAAFVWSVSIASAQGAAGGILGNVVDTTRGRLPGVSVVLRREGAPQQTAVTDAAGRYEFAAVAPGDYDLAFTLINFAQARRGVRVASGPPMSVDVVLQIDAECRCHSDGPQYLHQSRRRGQSCGEPHRYC